MPPSEHNDDEDLTQLEQAVQEATEHLESTVAEYRAHRDHRGNTKSEMRAVLHDRTRAISRNGSAIASSWLLKVRRPAIAFAMAAVAFVAVWILLPDDVEHGAPIGVATLPPGVQPYLPKATPSPTPTPTSEPTRECCTPSEDANVDSVVESTPGEDATDAGEPPDDETPKPEPDSTSESGDDSTRNKSLPQVDPTTQPESEPTTTDDDDCDGVQIDVNITEVCLPLG